MFTFRTYTLTTLVVASLTALGQNVPPDTTTMQTTLSEVVVEGASRGLSVSSVALEKREIINSIGLRKMACCTLAESFENSAGVSVDYSDAISGARQIKLLGLAGAYTQFLDESRPFMGGLVSPYALDFTPGDWLRSIQVSKGVGSVTAGHEAIAGQINLDFRKPTDDERLHVNFYLDDMLRPEVNLSSAISLNKDRTLSTIVMAHGSIDTDWREMKAMDRDGDNFRDLPSRRQISVANRWAWITPSGIQLRWGAKFTTERRNGGQIHDSYKRGDWRDFFQNLIAREYFQETDLYRYRSRIRNRDVGAYVKLAVPLNHVVADSSGNDLQDNIALIADWNNFNTRSSFGLNQYNARENTFSLAIRMDHYFSRAHSLAVGLQGKLSAQRGRTTKAGIYERLTYAGGIGYSFWYQQLTDSINEREAGLYAEWTYKREDRFTLVAGLRADYNDMVKKVYLTPRMHLKWNITPKTILRASAGTGYRTPRVLIEHLGVFANGYPFYEFTQTGPIDSRVRLEHALTAGGSLTQRFKLGSDRNASISLDYFHTHFFRSIFILQEPYGYTNNIFSERDAVFSNTWQLDFNWTPFTRFEIFATARYTQSKLRIPLIDGGSYTISRPLTSRFKGVLNLSYATRFRVWVFDFTAQLNGPARVSGQGKNGLGSYNSPTYAQLFAQVTRKINKAEVYLGCENITDYRQKHAIIGADAPFHDTFNATNVWGPLMGRKFYIGVRWNLY